MSRGREEGSFKSAAVHIAACVKILRLTLRDLNLNRWKALACYTGTSGRYKKTLVLKASASEKKDVYKVHLVPYFGSHLRATNQLYRALQGLKKAEPGGLLHWVGERERVVDYDMLRNGQHSKDGKKRIASFKLPLLKATLHAAAKKPSTRR
jgi:hypothetical protein